MLPSSISMSIYLRLKFSRQILYCRSLKFFWCPENIMLLSARIYRTIRQYFNKTTSWHISKQKRNLYLPKMLTSCSLFNLISIFFRVKSRYWLGVRICLTLWESENWVIQRLLWPGWPELLTSPDSSWSFSWQLQLAWGAGRPSNTNENELVRGKNILKCVQMGPECARHESYSYQAHPPDMTRNNWKLQYQFHWGGPRKYYGPFRFSGILIHYLCNESCS